MKLRNLLFILLAAGPGTSAIADDDRVKAAIGGGAGGAVGAVIGQELGDRNGAIVGAAVGGAVGAAIATDDDGKSNSEHHESAAEFARSGHPEGRHCPPGQAKKGRC